MLLNLTEIRPADYVNPEFFQSRGQSRPGDGLYALALAYKLRKNGVIAKEFSGFCQELAEKVSPQFEAASLSAGTRETVHAAAATWRQRCPEVTELLELAANAISDGKSLAGLIVHLGRILNQLDLLASMPPPDSAA